ncbi:hypothetical protein [Fictibacillus solisalsi]|uniref:hypothetical protein n=1 Tax=Fictibacillus solisalsi TaxID=459525 RepID=UPI00111379AF|nr:hypothetical protein [Fictibacillus solisalsi]
MGYEPKHEKHFKHESSSCSSSKFYRVEKAHIPPTYSKNVNYSVNYQKQSADYSQLLDGGKGGGKQSYDGGHHGDKKKKHKKCQCESSSSSSSSSCCFKKKKKKRCCRRRRHCCCNNWGWIF